MSRILGRTKVLALAVSRSLASCSLAGCIVVLTVGLSTSAFATPLTSLGTAMLNAGNGSVQVSGDGVTSGCIDWFSSVAPSSCQPDGTTSPFTVNGGSTLPFVAGQVGSIQDLNFNTPYPVVDFITVPGAAAQFDLKDLRTNNGAAIGSCTSATGDTNPGASCTPANSPFQITNGLVDPNTGMVDTVTISFTIDLFGYTGTSGTNYDSATKYVGIFTTQNPLNYNIDSLLAAIQNGQSIAGSWSASLSPINTTPEPSTTILLGFGLLALGVGCKRYARCN